MSNSLKQLSVSSQLKKIKMAESLQAIDSILTKSMASKSIQSLIKGDQLDIVVEAIVEFGFQNPENALRAVASLGRLGAISRTREPQVYESAKQLLTEEPPSFESLKEADEKLYAAQVLRSIDEPWVTGYCVTQALEIESAENARKELLLAVLEQENEVAEWLRLVKGAAVSLSGITDPSSRTRRARRVLVTLMEIVISWRGPVGDEASIALGQCLTSLLPRNIDDVDLDVLDEALDSFLTILTRIVELRFSLALQSSTY